MTTRKTIAFNTGRGYSAHGQRIAATQLDDGRVYFVDLDRHLDYCTAFPCDLTKTAVMDAYDRNLTVGPYQAGMTDDDLDATFTALRAAAKTAPSLTTETR